VELGDGKLMTAVRQNRSTGNDRDSLLPGSEVTVSWDLPDAFPLATMFDPESQSGQSIKEHHE
jgi:hypothetical protein